MTHLARHLTLRLRATGLALLAALVAGALMLLPAAQAAAPSSLALIASIRPSDVPGAEPASGTKGPFRTIDGFLRATLNQSAARRQMRHAYVNAGFQEGVSRWLRPSPSVSWGSVTTVVSSPDAATTLADFIHDFYVSYDWSVVADGASPHAFRVTPRGNHHPEEVAIIAAKGNVVISIDGFQKGGARLPVIERALARMLARVPATR